MPKWLKTILKILAVLVGVIVLITLSLTLYITFNKKKVLALVNQELNKNLNGTITIGDMQPSFFQGFPNVSLTLKNVLVRDKRWPEHHHTLLDAKNFNVGVNTAALLRGAISVNHIDISNAAIDLYTDSTGYSNTDLFKKKNKPKDKSNDNSSSSAEFGKISLNNVSFALNNQKKNKLFAFDINNLEGKMTYPDSGWHADLQLKVQAQSLAFNTDNGAFIKGEFIAGRLIAGYNEDTKKISVVSDALSIGNDQFAINAIFKTGGKPVNFDIRVAANQILWKHAASLLAANITQTLNKFNLAKPIAVKAQIAGSFGGGDPLLNVTGNVVNNTVTTPGGVINNCSFTGVFTNNYQNGKGLNDENSAIKLYHLTGKYNNLPFSIDTGSIINLHKPIAVGNIKSSFPISNLNGLAGDDIAKFGAGTASLQLHYKADIIDFRLKKPVVSGDINIKDASFTYVPRNLALTHTSLSMRFAGNDLILSNIKLQSGHSSLTMEGRVSNFLNFYYDAPEKVLLTWQVHSPQIHLAEFLGFLSAKKHVSKVVHKRTSNNIIDQLGDVLDKGNAVMHIQIDRLFYKNFLATNAHAELVTVSDGILIKDMGVQHAGGSLELNGRLIQGDNLNRFNINTTVNRVNVRDFFRSFDNFGLSGITYQNLKGFLSATAHISGGITDNGNLVPRSIKGVANVKLSNAELLDYSPLVSVGRFAFPFRNMKDIVIPSLNAKFDIHGDKIIINPMQINSSVINADVAGTYALSRGTNIAFDVPLRNPKNDEGITDKDELQQRRFKGLVLHLVAKDDENGKIKIGWNHDHK
ncbi:AsmA family protein [Mucilaginibacter robiniae]|uniref:AsmA family protein n=1 Tax=Mucilaginibacter robiniae TaxID=2728022 RepID=A0A7L5EAU8_9SPHI|nr:AsmA-like C-terminal region-containing protein [Mucilaginibacter robiniae]QJD98063.1 AsmA family protein [Mucilaginibacter robiniae]